jgi:hypothetical protein
MDSRPLARIDENDFRGNDNRDALLMAPAFDMIHSHHGLIPEPLFYSTLTPYSDDLAVMNNVFPSRPPN